MLRVAWLMRLKRCRVVSHVARDSGSVGFSHFVLSCKYYMWQLMLFLLTLADLLGMCIIDSNTIAVVCHRYLCIFSSLYIVLQV